MDMWILTVVGGYGVGKTALLLQVGLLVSHFHFY